MPDNVYAESADFITAPEWLNGRRKILSSVEYLDENNVISVVNDALSWHGLNLNEENYLYWYRRGIQPILFREKEVRPEINHKIVNNIYNTACVFKNGYFLQSPAAYVSRKSDEATVAKVAKLNEFLYSCGKQRADNQVTNWFHTVGLGPLYVEPSRDNNPNRPYNAYSLDPRQAFVVYSTRPGNPPVYGVNVVAVGRQYLIDVFTRDLVFHLSGGATGRTVSAYRLMNVATAVSVLSVEPNVLGRIPIIEYQYNDMRMGAPESAISLMDAYNEVLSNVNDSIDQFVQSLLVTYNCEFEEGTDANRIRQYGMVNLKSNGENKADIKMLSQVLDQTQTKITLDNLYEQILDKCGVPFVDKSGGSSADNGVAVYLRNGWASADTDARCTEDLFKESNRLFDEVMLEIVRRKVGIDLDIEDFELQIDRNSTSNLLTKTQAAINMRQLGLAPQIALERSGLSNDPLKDIELSRDYIFRAWEHGDGINYAVQSVEDATNDRAAEMAVDEGAMTE